MALKRKGVEPTDKTLYDAIFGAWPTDNGEPPYYPWIGDDLDDEDED